MVNLEIYTDINWNENKFVEYTDRLINSEPLNLFVIVVFLNWCEDFNLWESLKAYYIYILQI